MESWKDYLSFSVESKINFANQMNHQQLMFRCLHLAQFGQGMVAPNPMVGSLLLYGDKIIGEGWHRAFGEAHAEVNAINDVTEPFLLAASTLYVNLEPCSHHGKTPPCTDFIISKGIKKVVIGMIDPFAAVNGNGVRLLREAGIDVTVNVLEAECRELNKRFITYQTEKRPYIILKWAQSADGYIGRSGKRVHISNPLSRVLTHQLRSTSSAILVGTNTVLADDPQLNVRHWFGKNPLRVSIDKEKRIPARAKILDGSQETLLFTFEENALLPNVEYEKLDPSNSIPEQIIKSLYKRNIRCVLIEGGTFTIESFLSIGMWDEAFVFHSPQLLLNGVKAPELNLFSFKEEQIGDNRLQIFKR